MLLTKRDTVVFAGIIVGIVILSWYLQGQLMLNWDVDWLLHSARLSLEGKTYAKDFFSPNPPVVLLLYMPPVIYSKWLGVKIMLPFKLYMFSLAIFSFLLCSYLAAAIFTKEDKFLGMLFLTGLMCLFLLLPMHHFGQRETVLLILIMPYLFLIVLRLQNYPIKPALAVLIGFLAAAGFSMKPQFLAVFFLVEFYVVIYGRRLTGLKRVETITIVGTFVLFLLATLTFYPDYLSVVVPYVVANYYRNLSMPFSMLASNPLAYFCCIPILFYFMFYQKNPYQILSSVLVLALCGLLIAYFAQHTLFAYHIIPAFSMAILLSLLLYGNLIFQPHFNRNDYVKMTILVSALFAFSAENPLGYDAISIYEPMLFYSFFTVLFAILIYAGEKTSSQLKILASVAAIIVISFYGSYLASRIAWYSYHLYITLFILVGVFALCVSKAHKNLSGHIYLALIGLLMFCYPVVSIDTIYKIGTEYKKSVLNPLVAFMQGQAPKQSLYVLSIHGDYGVPLIDYADSRLVQRFDCLWMVGDLVRREQINGAVDVRDYIKNNTDKNFFINQLAEDFKNHKPDFIFVDVKKDNVMLNGRYYNFNFVDMFNQNIDFKKEWLHYHYFTTLTGKTYDLQIYKRMD